MPLGTFILMIVAHWFLKKGDIMNKKIMIGYVLFIILTSILVFATTQQNINYVSVGKGVYEKWELTQSIDVKQLQEDVTKLNKEIEELKNNKADYINSCMDECEKMCNIDYDMKLKNIDMEIEGLNKQIGEVS